MGESTVPDSDQPATSLAAGAVSMALVAIMLLVTREFIRPMIGSMAVIDAWLVGAALVAAVWGIAHGVSRRAGTTPDGVRRWRMAATGLQLLLSIGVASVVWIELPGAIPALRAMVIMMTIWHIAVVALAAGTMLRVAIVEVGVVAGSMGAFLVATPFPNHLGWALTLPVTAGALIGLRIYVTRVIAQARAARAASERAEATMRAALAVAAAERDAKTRFIAAASHDLQQPLHAAGLFFDMAIAAPPGLERTRAIAGARAAFASTGALLETMLDHLRLEAGAVPVRLAPLALGPALAAAALEHEAAARLAGVGITVVPTRAIALADPDLLRRSLGNLLGNVLRHARARRVLVAARRRSGMCEIWVIDDGVGIAPADAARMFDDFAQGTRADAAPGGFGLGLASVRRQLALMEGSAAHEPRWRRGAAFVLRLRPATDAPELALAAE